MPAIAAHSTATTTAAWDGPANEARLKADGSASYYKSEFAWYDSEGDDTKKGTYKFPHHMVSGDGAVGAANVKACQSIIGSLNGGRGGAKIPDGDRKGVYNHAAKHLRDADVEPAELKSAQQVDEEFHQAMELAAAGGPKMERRVYDFELRVDPLQESNPEMAGPCISGHASVFNSPADLGYFTETVKPGAFKRTIAEDDIRALFNHNPDYVLGRNTSNTLTLREDYKGLKVEIDPPDTSVARDLMTSIKRGDISQASIGFYARGFTLRKDDAGKWYRDLTDIQLFDVSPVTFPAFTATDMNVRTAEMIAATFRSGPEDPKPAEEAWKADLVRRRRMLELVRD